MLRVRSIQAFHDELVRAVELGADYLVMHPGSSCGTDTGLCIRTIAESLRQHSDYMRVRRRQEAEERAAKVGVKLVFPIFFFILPAMMLVCAGPGVLASVGVYQGEGLGIHLFEHIEGDHSVVLGLPMLSLLAWLRRENLISL